MLNTPPGPLGLASRPVGEEALTQSLGSPEWALLPAAGDSPIRTKAGAWFWGAAGSFPQHVKGVLSLKAVSSLASREKRPGRLEPFRDKVGWIPGV